MLPRPRGYNHDVRYRGEVFHIQSEVCGSRDRQVRTQLFSRGAVLATERTPVDDSDDAGVDSLLRAQHKSLLRELCNGTFDAWLAPDAAAQAAQEPPARPPIGASHVAIRRHGVTLEVRGRDAADRCELAIEVCLGADILAVRRIAYEAADQAARIESLLAQEVEQMVAKVRRGGLDARLPASGFVFVPPPIPTR